MAKKTTPSILTQITADTVQANDALKDWLPLAELKAKLEDDPLPIRPFRDALAQAHAHSYAHPYAPAIIAEIKKASPSAGLIRADFDVANIAQAYQKAGATCLSILTDEKYFQGSIYNLLMARTQVNLPLLRKDFIIDEYQIYHSRLLGADCILLIMACLSTAQAQEFYQLAKQLGMDVLVEVHDKAELQQALSFQPDMIGVNNRNLKTLKIDLATTKKLAPLIPQDTLLICESGLQQATDLHEVSQMGAHGFLIGESLMRQENIEQALSRLRTEFQELSA